MSGSSIEVNPKRVFDITARAGYLVTDGTLLYARAGYTNVRATTTDTGPTATRRGTANLGG